MLAETGYKYEVSVEDDLLQKRHRQFITHYPHSLLNKVAFEP